MQGSKQSSLTFPGVGRRKAVKSSWVTWYSLDFSCCCICGEQLPSLSPLGSWAHALTALVCELPHLTICLSHCWLCSKLAGRKDTKEESTFLLSLQLLLLIHVSNLLLRLSCVQGPQTSGCPSVWYPGLLAVLRARGTLLSEMGVWGKETWPASLEKGKK